MPQDKINFVVTMTTESADKLSQIVQSSDSGVYVSPQELMPLLRGINEALKYEQSSRATKMMIDLSKLSTALYSDSREDDVSEGDFVSTISQIALTLPLDHPTTEELVGLVKEYEEVNSQKSTGNVKTSGANTPI